MIDSDALIFVTLSLIILFLIYLLKSKRSIENFELTNNVPDKMKKELNYLKQVLKEKENDPLYTCCRNQRCRRCRRYCSNQRESWCYGKNDQDVEEKIFKNI